MQKKNKITGYLLIIILCLCFHFQLKGNSRNSTITDFYQESIDLPLAIVESDDQIFINSDEDFVSLGLPGTGTLENPYKIENKSIIIDDFSPGIEVYNTTKHFVIQNCYFEMTRIGIRIRRVAANTALIRDNEFKNNPITAIEILSTHYARIENNTGKHNLEGIYVSHSNFTSIVNNSLFGSYTYEGILDPSGLKFLSSWDASIISNSINNYEQCIYARQCSGFLIENNTCLYSRADGSIHLYMSSDMIVRRNLIYYNLAQSGIHVYLTDNCEILYNTIYHCALWGIALIGSDDNYIHHNNLIDNMILDQPQCFDNGINNIWYVGIQEEGNYWSDWSGIGPHEIDGSVPNYNYDLYPLTNLSGIEIGDLYFPNTTNDDTYEENDYTFNNPDIALSITHNLHYADIDFFRINLQKSWKYSFLLNFNYNTIDLDFYLLEDSFYEVEFNVLNGSYSNSNNEWFTFIAPDYGYYNLYVVGDLEQYKEIIPTDYQLTITTIAFISTTPSQTVGNIFLINLIVIFPIILVVTKYKRNNQKYKNHILNEVN